MTTEERTKINDPAVMRALAHPARLAIMEHLAGPAADATATDCAEVVGLSPSATSYHLRALAKAGLVEEAPSRGDGRERVWRTRARSYSAFAEQGADDEAFSAAEALAEVFLQRDDLRVRQWMGRARQEPPEWYEVSILREAMLLLTAAELRQLHQRIDELIRPYVRKERTDPPAGARQVAFQLRTIPTD